MSHSEPLERTNTYKQYSHKVFREAWKSEKHNGYPSKIFTLDDTYRRWGKIRWAKLSRFLSLLRKFSCL